MSLLGRVSFCVQASRTPRAGHYHSLTQAKPKLLDSIPLMGMPLPFSGITS